MTKTEITVEAIKFYAEQNAIGFKDVVWAIEMGNEKVANAVAELIIKADIRSGSFAVIDEMCDYVAI